MGFLYVSPDSSLFPCYSFIPLSVELRTISLVFFLGHRKAKWEPPLTYFNQYSLSTYHSACHIIYFPETFVKTIDFLPCTTLPQIFPSERGNVILLNGARVHSFQSHHKSRNHPDSSLSLTPHLWLSLHNMPKSMSLPSAASP